MRHAGFSLDQKLQNCTKGENGWSDFPFTEQFGVLERMWQCLEQGEDVERGGDEAVKT